MISACEHYFSQYSANISAHKVTIFWTLSCFLKKGSIPGTFPTAVILVVQLDFKNDDIDARDPAALEKWVGDLMEKSLALKYGFPCEIHLALTDVTHW